MGTEKQAWDVAPPISGSASDGLDGVFREATSGTSKRRKIPQGWRGRWVTFKAKTEDCDVLFGGSTVDCVYGQVTTASGENIVFNASAGGTISAGQSEPFYIPLNKAVTHFSFEAAGAGELSAYPSSNRFKDGFDYAGT